MENEENKVEDVGEASGEAKDVAESSEAVASDAGTDEAKTDESSEDSAA